MSAPKKNQWVQNTLFALSVGSLSTVALSLGNAIAVRKYTGPWMDVLIVSSVLSVIFVGGFAMTAEAKMRDRQVKGFGFLELILIITISGLSVGFGLLADSHPELAAALAAGSAATIAAGFYIANFTVNGDLEEANETLHAQNAVLGERVGKVRRASIFTFRRRKNGRS